MLRVRFAADDEIRDAGEVALDQDRLRELGHQGFVGVRPVEVGDLRRTIGHRPARGVGRRRRLEVVPVLDDLAVRHAEDVEAHERRGAEDLRVLVRAVQDHEIAVREHAMGRHAKAAGLDRGQDAHHGGEPGRHAGVVLDVVLGEEVGERLHVEVGEERGEAGKDELGGRHRCSSFWGRGRRVVRGGGDPTSGEHCGEDRSAGAARCLRVTGGLLKGFALGFVPSGTKRNVPLPRARVNPGVPIGTKRRSRRTSRGRCAGRGPCARWAVRALPVPRVSYRSVW